MDFFATVAARYSYRDSFRPVRIPRADLERIVQAGIQAPAAHNIQTTEFVIVDAPALLGQLAELIDKVHIRTAPAIIIVVAHDLPNPSGISFATQNYSVAAENILLAITASGYAGVWMDDAQFDGRLAARIAELLNLPAGRQVALVIPVGVPTESRAQRPKLAFAELARFNKYPD